MQEIFNIIEKLRTLSGNAQLDFLSQHKDNKTLRDLLLYTYDSDKKYGIQETSLEKSLEAYRRQVRLSEVIIYKNIDKSCWERFRTCLDEFSNKKGIKENEIEEFVKKFYDFYKHDELEYLFKGVLLKDLKINMGLASFAKIWPETFFKPQVQLANKIKEQVFKNGFYSRKFDGKRQYILDGIPFSRTNKSCSIAPISHILSQFDGNIKDNIVLDGECLYFDENGKEDFQKGISLTSRDERLPECNNICYVIFDVLLKDKFIVSEDSGVKFEDEYKFMLNNFADFSKDSPCYSLIPTIWDKIYIARQDKDIEKLSKLSKENNWEGLMYRNGDVSYEYKRTNNLLKIKKMEDAEFQLVRFNIGTGKYADTLGSITVSLPTGETVDVGSGFLDSDRKYIWDNQEELLKKNLFVKVQYFEKTTDKKGNNSLRFPVFLCFRDKDGLEIL